MWWWSSCAEESIASGANNSVITMMVGERGVAMVRSFGSGCGGIVAVVVTVGERVYI